ncbi:hypothetical protein [Mycolicibacterium mageritense]|uniref:hypothetical protein n=1 Tax=Mycolicibacterium mageritense TaxID=53462 RepID=UPI001E658DFD|nr:hypothetical protein [Mycolicibacterium mageritense]GJJ19905.1 hypothetical protein MTY414_35780 [Mycolicibacterium mageritense]
MARGISTQGDVLVSKSADGVELNAIWDQIAAALEVWNNQRSALTRLLSYPTTNVADAVPQSTSSDSFELASEFGVPQSAREPATALPLGYDFYDYDRSARYTWRFLRDSTAEQIRSVTNRILEADNRLVNGTILKRLFTPTEGSNEQGHRVFGLWNGTDSLAPPPHMGKTFSTNHTHYLASGAAQIDSGDIEDAIRLIQEHGYGLAVGTQLLILANPDDGQFIETWRAGVESRTSGPKAKHDFVPSTSAPAYLSEETIHGAQAPASYENLPVLGSYGRAWVIAHQYVPEGYVAVVASGGANSSNNPIAVRQHTNTYYQGLRIIPGAGRYPLQDAFYQRTFGVGTRHRGAACVFQVKASGSYEAPTALIPV